MRPDNWADLICAEAETWKGTPYVPHALVKGSGCDCGGLIYQVYGTVFGPFAPYPTDYPPDWAAHKDDERYLDFIKPYVREIKQPIRGCISLFHVGLAYAHAAIYVGNQNYIHAWGRQREGAVTQTKARVLLFMSAPTEPKHFEPI